MKHSFAIFHIVLSRFGANIRAVAGRAMRGLIADAPPLGGVLALLIAACLALAGSALSSAFNGNYLPLLPAVFLWLPLAWGLWQRRRLARRVALALLWLIIVILPIGVINPFAAMDRRISIDTPLWQLLVPVFSIVAAALFMIHILGKYKAEYGRNDQ